MSVKLLQKNDCAARLRKVKANRVIVSNASPLIVLAKINKLSILKELFEKIVVPTAAVEFGDMTETEWARALAPDLTAGNGVIHTILMEKGERKELPEP